MNLKEDNKNIKRDITTEERKSRLIDLFSSRENDVAYDSTEKQLLCEMLFINQNDDNKIVSEIKEFDSSNFSTKLNAELFDKFANYVTTTKSRNVDIQQVNISMSLLPKSKADIQKAYKDAGGVKLLKSIVSYSKGKSTAVRVDDIPELLQKIKNFSSTRKLIKKSIDFIDTINIGENIDEEDLDLKFTEVSKLFYNIQESDKENVLPMKQIIAEWESLLYGVRDNGVQQIGLNTGFEILDDKLSGIRPGQMYVVGARPGMGKTAFILNLANNLIKDETNLKSDGTKPNVVMFSLEMGRYELVERLASINTGIPKNSIRQGQMTDDEWSDISYYIKEGKQDKNLYIDDTASLTIFDIKQRIAKLQEETNGVDLVIIDYLQLVSSSNNNRQQAIAEISREVKKIAKEYNTTIIALSQLNRDVEGRTDKRPGLADLRESGQIEQDADIVIMISRNDYYESEEDDVVKDTSDSQAIVSIVKNRDGKQGDIKFMFHKNIGVFVEMEQTDDYDDEIISDDAPNNSVIIEDSDEKGTQLFNVDDLFDE